MLWQFGCNDNLIIVANFFIYNCQPGFKRFGLLALKKCIYGAIEKMALDVRYGEIRTEVIGKLENNADKQYQSEDKLNEAIKKTIREKAHEEDK